MGGAGRGRHSCLVAVAATPTKLDLFPYYEAPGLSMLALWNREWHWPEGRVETALILLVARRDRPRRRSSVPPRPRPRRARRRLARRRVRARWNLTNEIYAAYGEYDLSERMSRNFTQPHDWVDRAAGDGTVTLVGQQFGTDFNGIHLLEFWNRSIDKVWSVDPASPAPGPGPTQTPDLIKADGTLWPSPGTDYALAVNGVALQVDPSPRDRTTWQTLYRLDGGPLKLATRRAASSRTAGWASKAAYNRFDLRRPTLELAARRSRAELRRSSRPKRPWYGDGQARALTDRQRPAAGARTASRTTRTRRNGAVQRRLLIMRPPPGPWRVEIEAATPTFVAPAARPSRTSDIRSLTARWPASSVQAQALRQSGGDDVGEAVAQREPGERPARARRPQQRADRRRQGACLGHEERAQLDVRQARRPQVLDDLLERRTAAG